MVYTELEFEIQKSEKARCDLYARKLESGCVTYTEVRLIPVNMVKYSIYAHSASYSESHDRVKYCTGYCLIFVISFNRRWNWSP